MLMTKHVLTAKLIRNKIRNIQMDFNFESQMLALFGNQLFTKQ